jgi:hypothetical protein
MQSFAASIRDLVRLLKRNRRHTVILRSRALARRLEGSPRTLLAYPSRLAEDGEHLRMTTRGWSTRQSFGKMAGIPRHGRDD